jgi:hypothetical protein
MKWVSGSSCAAGYGCELSCSTVNAWNEFFANAYGEEKKNSIELYSFQNQQLHCIIASVEIMHEEGPKKTLEILN